MKVEIIRALTPMFFGTIGFFIAITVLIVKPTTEVTYAALALGSTALGVGGGLSQSSKPADKSTNIENIETNKIE